MAREIPLGSPVDGPIRMHQHCLIRQVQALKLFRRDSPALPRGYPHYDCFEVRQLQSAPGTVGSSLAGFLLAYRSAKEQAFGGGSDAGELLKQAAAAIREALPEKLRCDFCFRIPLRGEGRWSGTPCLGLTNS